MSINSNYRNTVPDTFRVSSDFIKEISLKISEIGKNIEEMEYEQILYRDLAIARPWVSWDSVGTPSRFLLGPLEPPHMAYAKRQDLFNSTVENLFSTVNRLYVKLEASLKKNDMRLQTLASQKLALRKKYDKLHNDHADVLLVGSLVARNLYIFEKINCDPMFLGLHSKGATKQDYIDAKIRIRDEIVAITERLGTVPYSTFLAAHHTQLIKFDELRKESQRKFANYALNELLNILNSVVQNNRGLTPEELETCKSHVNSLSKKIVSKMGQIDLTNPKAVLSALQLAIGQKESFLQIEETSVKHSSDPNANDEVKGITERGIDRELNWLNPNVTSRESLLVNLRELKALFQSNPGKMDIEDRICYHLYFYHLAKNPANTRGIPDYGRNALYAEKTSLEDIQECIKRTRTDLILKTLIDAVNAEDVEVIIKYFTFLEREDTKTAFRLRWLVYEMCKDILLEKSNAKINLVEFNLSHPNFGRAGFCNEDRCRAPTKVKLQALNETIAWLRDYRGEE